MRHRLRGKRTMLRNCLTIAFIIGGVVAAPAETTIVLNPKDRPMMPGAEQVRVSVGVNMFVPLTDGGEQAIKAQEDARRLVYVLLRANAPFCATCWRANVVSNRSTSMCSAISSGSRRTA
jgi:hypothetical protein